MASLLKLTEGTVLGLHAMVFLAEQQGRMVNTAEIASYLKASKAHLSKVLQRLSHEGFVVAERGSKGGFSLARPADEVTLRDIYEALEGALRLDGCLFSKKTCERAHCILGSLVKDVRKQVSAYFSRTTLQDLIEERPTKSSLPG